MPFDAADYLSQARLLSASGAESPCSPATAARYGCTDELVSGLPCSLVPKSFQGFRYSVTYSSDKNYWCGGAFGGQGGDGRGGEGRAGQGGEGGLPLLGCYASDNNYWCRVEQGGGEGGEGERSRGEKNEGLRHCPWAETVACYKAISIRTGHGAAATA